MDTAWLIRGLGQGRRVVDLLCERECIFQRLPQTTPEKLQKNTKGYTIDPQVSGESAESALMLLCCPGNDVIASMYMQYSCMYMYCHVYSCVYMLYKCTCGQIHPSVLFPVIHCTPTHTHTDALSQPPHS